MIGQFKAFISQQGQAISIALLALLFGGRCCWGSSSRAAHAGVQRAVSDLRLPELRTSPQGADASSDQRSRPWLMS
jgi:hypothetical protein